ncbi:M57 family metalloprotease [Blastopirellula marina]|uniref:Peptidase metallopeptidase domain-containing protein n=1 Tax=Blastopirellula marina TaxID=124 RepID=A0A2S8G1F8_9BACT|nr:M57 family metalloprotease [Blastopirellula marina]PQO37964.1 hypothetical protein C5Y98_07675 [Blastopirellula marina]PTL44620.1 hypothetical protein C5Y97_07675 [Blastopirellula marina]
MQKTPRRHQANMEVRIAECLESRLCLSSTGWDGIGQGEASLTYYVGDVPADFGLTQAEVEQAVADVLQTWADVIQVTFTQIATPNQRDSIDIEFGNIDGAGGTLAQAYFPDDINPAVIAGDILVDVSEAWEIGNALGSAAFDLAYVLTHEVGHSLGLEHSDSPNSVMYDTVRPDQEFTGLSEEDIDAALALYAPAETQTTTTAPSDQDETPSEDPTDTPNEDTPANDTPEEETPTEDPDDAPTTPDDDSDGNDEDLPADDPTDETPSDPGDNEDGSDEDEGDGEEPETPPTEDPRALPRFRTPWGRNFFTPFARPGHGPANTNAHHLPGNQTISEAPSSRVGIPEFGRQRHR